jgi:poly-gamma-glutamate synthase PgsB/CapB
MVYLILLILICWFVASWSDLYLYQKKLANVPLRVHVNGIRGKSSIVRYLAAILRKNGYQTLAKTTGTAPRIIGFSGEEISLKRAGLPNIFEQLLLMKYFISLKPQAVVVECMATNPNYAEWLEHKVMRSSIYIMTNVRLDHQDQLGSTLPEIARSLSGSIPYRSTVITGEASSEILNIFESVCDRRHTNLVAPCSTSSLEFKNIDLSNFSHVPIVENIKVCLAFASLLNISPDEALTAMASTIPDPGQFSIKTFFARGTEIAWANLFAVNDKESFLEWAYVLINVHETFEPVIILNNRKDRVDRVGVFADCVKALSVSKVVTMGDCEDMVAAQLGGKISILKLGNGSLYRNISGEDLLNRVLSRYKSDRILLIGAVNIHTDQADRLLDYLKTHKSDPLDSFSPEYI